MTDFSRTVVRKARKTYFCDWCEVKRIFAGDTYQYIVGTSDGQFCQVRYCLKCAGLLDDMRGEKTV